MQKRKKEKKSSILYSIKFNDMFKTKRDGRG